MDMILIGAAAGIGFPMGIAAAGLVTLLAAHAFAGLRDQLCQWRSQYRKRRAH